MPATAPTFPIPRSPQDLPVFKTLNRAECEVILSRNDVGRIAFALHDRVNIVPIHYVYLDGWIYGRTGSAGKLREILRNRRIAFEVDEHSELFEWRSVIVHGPLYLIQPDTTQRANSIYGTALSVIRKLIPDALTHSDPVPFRDQLFRIRAVDVTGRASLPVGGERLTPATTDRVVETAEPDLDAEVRERAEVAIAQLGIPETSDVHVEAFDGVIVLSGRVATPRDRHAIEAAILNVPAVFAVVEDLETRFPLKQESAPAEVARAALEQLRAAPPVAASGIKIVVEHGWLRLEGFATSAEARDEALRRLRSVKGSRGVIDKLRVVGIPTAQIVADDRGREHD